MIATDGGSLFDILDKDGDGSISREESKALLNKFLENAPVDASEEEKAKLIDECFTKADVDSDGSLSKAELQEFVAILEAAASSMGSAVTSDSSTSLATYISKPRLVDAEGKADMALFADFDTNGDAKLDIGEAQTLLLKTLENVGLDTEWLTRDWIKAQFCSLDTDGDAETLTQDEYRKFVDTVMNWLTALGGAVPGDVVRAEADNNSTSGNQFESGVSHRVPPPDTTPRPDEPSAINKGSKGCSVCSIM